jgi:hypothetical protein
MKSLSLIERIYVCLDPYPSMDIKKDASVISSGLKIWGEPYNQKVRCEKIASRINQVFNDGFTCGISRIRIICASFTHKGFQIIFCLVFSPLIFFYLCSSPKLDSELVCCRARLSDLSDLVNELRLLYKHEILHSAKRMLENYPYKQNNKIFKSSISKSLSLFQTIKNIEVLDRMSVTNFGQSLVKVVPKKSIQRDNVDLKTERQNKYSRGFLMFQTFSKKTVPSRKNFSLNLLHMSRNPGHNLLNYFWTFLKSMNTKHLIFFDNLSTI